MLCVLGGKEGKIFVVLKGNNKFRYVMGIIIYGIIKVNVMVFDFVVYNFSFNRNRDFFVSKRKLDNLIFIFIYV